MSYQSDDNDMDRLLQGAFESRPRAAGSNPSMIDVRHRARRHQRRRVGGVVGATAILGASGVAVLASRGGPESGIAGDEATTTWALTGAGPICGYDLVGAFPAATIGYPEPTTTITWLDTTLPSEATSTTLSDSSSCPPSGQFRCLGNTGTDDQGYSYFEYCEPINPADSSFPYPATTAYDFTTHVVIATTSPTPIPNIGDPTPTTSDLAPTTTTELMAATTT